MNSCRHNLGFGKVPLAVGVEPRGLLGTVLGIGGAFSFHGDWVGGAQDAGQPTMCRTVPEGVDRKKDLFVSV